MLSSLDGKAAERKVRLLFQRKASREIFWVTWRDLEDRTSKTWDGVCPLLIGLLYLKKETLIEGSDVAVTL